jgi:hypothetical protein
VIVEVAFVMPILLALVLGLMDFSLWELQDSQVSSAARDGARTGVVLTLDSASSFAEIEGAARAKIPDVDELEDFEVQVWCSGGTPGVTWDGCDDAVPGTTRLVVRTSWSYRPLSFVGDTFAGSTISSTAEMVWNGPTVPGGSSVPPVCSVTFGAPTVPPLDGSTLSDDLELPFTTNGHSSCAGFSAQLREGSMTKGNVTVPAPSGTSATITFSPSQVPNLNPGSHTIRLTSGGRQWQTTVDLSDCAISDVAVPSGADAPELASTDDELVQDLEITYTASGDCDRPGEARIIDRDMPGRVLVVQIDDLRTGSPVTFDADPASPPDFWGPGIYDIAIDSSAPQLSFDLP